MSAAIYARHSTDRQETSNADQFRECEERAAREGWKVAARYEDRAMSGANLNRPGYKAMLAAAEAREFDVLLVWKQNRLGRDEFETGKAIQRLEFWGIRVLGLKCYYDSALPARLRNSHRRMNAQQDADYRENLAEDTHRGLKSRAIDGRSAGGRAYGYKSEPIEDASRKDRYGKSEVVGYRRLIDPKKAPVVVDIFSMYADGMNPKAIARELNRRNVPSPASDWNRATREKRADGKWMGSAIYAMLDNEIYVGQVVWNKSRWEKDPDGGRRVRRERPEVEWIRREDKSLRILNDALWRRVKARQKQVVLDNATLRASLKVLNNGNPAGRRPTNFWSGLLVCGTCGRNFIKTSRYHYGCGSYANGGEHACGNTQRALASILDARILRSIKEELVTDDRIRLMERAMREHFAAEIAKIKAVGAREQTVARLAAVETELGNVADAIAQIGLNPKLTEKLETLTQEKKHLRSAARNAQADPRLLFDIAAELPKLMRRNLEAIEHLGTNKRPTDSRMIGRAQQAMRGLVGRITLKPRRAGLVAVLEVTGERVTLLAQEAARGASQQKQQAIKMVAGVGFEPTTFGL